MDIFQISGLIAERRTIIYDLQLSSRNFQLIKRLAPGFEGLIQLVIPLQ